jgi:serine/threonine-protein kinase
MDLAPGRLIAGRYRLQERLGSGGMGEVWAAEHVAIGVRVALKTLLPAAALDQQLVARFRREAYLLGRLRSDRVARVVDFVEDRRIGLVLVMDYVEGEALGAVLAERTLSVEEAIDLGIDLAAALCDLHRAKVVHRDLKPDNIILEPGASGRARAVIVDFGVSRLLSEPAEEESLTSITQADVAVGTIPYMAPEQFLSSRDVSGSADLYALGAILYRAVAGEHVYGGDEDLDYAKRKLTTDAPELPLRRVDRVARGLSRIVARALARSPDDRFPDAAALLDELTGLRDVARATALDLEAATEQAPPPSAIADEPTDAEPTRLLSRPPHPPEDLLADAELPRDTLSRDSLQRATAVPSTVPSPTMEPLREQLDVAEAKPASPPTHEALPAENAFASGPPAPRGFSRSVLFGTAAAALLAGAGLGLAAGALLFR